MRALMNLAIEPSLLLFEVSAQLVAEAGQRTITRILKVLASTPEGAVNIVRDRYPQSRRHQVLSRQSWVDAAF